jgi:opacity protein-like surface antigen
VFLELEQEIAMTKILAVAALAALIATPASAQSMKNSGSDAGQKSYAASDSQKAKAKKKKVVTTYTQPRRAWAYSSNPEFDVYVRGEYVGSDPDPRIRASLRDEAKRYYGIRN